MTNETSLTIREHNIETDEVIDRPMTSEEFEAHERIMAAQEAEKEAEAAKTADRAALLIKLGITEEEARLLLS